MGNEKKVKIKQENNVIVYKQWSNDNDFYQPIDTYELPELLNLLLIKYNLIEIPDYIKFINNPPKDIDKKYYKILKDNKHLII
jgi:hypothetical protein